MNCDPHVRLDGHVHFYGCFQAGDFLAAAASNLDARADPPSGLPAAVLLLSESRGCHWFDQLAQATGGAGALGALGNWRVEPVADDPLALRAVDSAGRQLLIVAGRQVVTGDGIEVLTLVTGEQIPDGLALEAVLEQAASAGAVPVLPWAVGKWLGRRGQRLRRVIEAPPVPLLVGDNGGRPWAWQTPRLLREAKDRGLRLLPGSDPLPLPGEESKVGTYGALSRWPAGLQSPSEALRHMLLSPELPLEPFGALETLPRFVRNQVRLRQRGAGSAGPKPAAAGGPR